PPRFRFQARSGIPPAGGVPTIPPLYVAEHHYGVDYGESESPPQVGSHQTQPSEMDKGAAKQRNKKPVAARRLETQDADTRIAARRGVFPRPHAGEQQRDDDEEHGRRPRPRHPGKV